MADEKKTAQLPGGRKQDMTTQHISLISKDVRDIILGYGKKEHKFDEENIYHVDTLFGLFHGDIRMEWDDYSGYAHSYGISAKAFLGKVYHMEYYTKLHDKSKIPYMPKEKHRIIQYEYFYIDVEKEYVEAKSNISYVHLNTHHGGNSLNHSEYKNKGIKTNVKASLKVCGIGYKLISIGGYIKLRVPYRITMNGNTVIEGNPEEVWLVSNLVKREFDRDYENHGEFSDDDDYIFPGFENQDWGDFGCEYEEVSDLITL